MGIDHHGLGSTAVTAAWSSWSKVLQLIEALGAGGPVVMTARRSTWRCTYSEGKQQHKHYEHVLSEDIGSKRTQQKN